MKEKNTGKLSSFTKIGYGFGTAGDSIPYTLFFTYFIFYLTDIAGVSAAIAGVVSFLAIVWQGITGPIIGYMSDNSTNPKGRRRPLIIKIIVPYAIILVLLFTPVPFAGGGKAAYYLIKQCCYGLATLHTKDRGMHSEQSLHRTITKEI